MIVEIDDQSNRGKLRTNKDESFIINTGEHIPIGLSLAIYYLETEKCHISKFSDLFNFCGRDLEKFALLLRKGVMCYEYIDSREKLKEKSSPPKEKIFSRLIKTRNMCKVSERKRRLCVFL